MATNMGDDYFKSLEYPSLREEMLQNRKYIFARPLLILTTIGIVASIQGKDTFLLIFLPTLFSFFMMIDMWFTVNRLRSNSRIAAYIEVFLEPGIIEGKNVSLPKPEFIGWEKSLRKYRKWKAVTKKEDREKAIAQYYEETAVQDALMFYPPIYDLHVVLVLLSCAVSIFFVYFTPESIQIFGMLLNIGVAYLFIVGYCLWEYLPENMKDLIERERATWLAVFEDSTLELPYHPLYC
jgi:hypothetical protein